MPESSRDMQMPRYSRCRDIVGSEYKCLGSVTRRHRKFPFLRHTYDDLKMTALAFPATLNYRNVFF